MGYIGEKGEDKYISRNQGGKLLLKRGQTGRPRPQSSGISNEMRNLVTGNIGKNEGSSYTQQATGAEGLVSRYQLARDPNETIKGLLQLQELAPPGLKKQGKLVNAMEGGLAGILESFKNSPMSALNLQGVGAGIDQLFGTNTAQILQPTTHNLAMQIPKLAEMVSKERGKFSAAEQQYLGRILGDYDTRSNKASQSEIGNYKQGLSAAASQAGVMTQAQQNAYTDRQEKLDRTARTRVIKEKKASKNMLGEMQDISSILKKYELSDIPGLGEKGGGLPGWLAGFFEDTEQRKLDFQEIKRLSTKLANMEKKEIEGSRGSDQDFNVAKETIGAGFLADPQQFLNALNRLTQWKREHMESLMQTLPARERRIMKEDGIELSKPWQDLKIELLPFEKTKEGLRLEAERRENLLKGRK